MDLLFDEVDSLLVFLAGAEHLEPQLSAVNATGTDEISARISGVSALVEQVQRLTDMVASFDPPPPHP
ncbi:hypothetical protein [Aquabacterium sp. A08]|uniref:hypothetical protein n=1 Tax=Aquabacterium sp. A08 TaxID=2718532 RepID=UPI001422A86C|nr:hypothetical protein [Aquabacterium sp. A08]NIC43624.1 hypothetical protein [Aquabacterium sp. A08]